MYYQTDYSSPLGLIVIASDGKSIVGLWNEGQKYFGGSITDKLTRNDSLPVFDAVRRWLDDYFSGMKPAVSDLKAPLLPIGSEFSRAVWSILCEIPYGQVTTYSEVAKAAAKRLNRRETLCRAVGGAVGRNPVSIIIPCHRVVGANGNLTGYAGGLEKKIKLLELEGADTSGLFLPAKVLQKR